MAGMQITPIADFSPTPVATQVQRVKSPLADTKRPEVQKKEKNEKKEELRDVVSRSKDGDTVQVTDKSTEKLEDDRFGRVDVLPKDGEKKADEESQALYKTDQKTEEQKAFSLKEEEKKLSNLPGTDQKMEEQKAASIKEDEEKPLNTTGVDQRSEDQKSLAIKEQDKEKAQEKEEKKQAVTSFAGMTEDQLEVMYRKGEISKQEYDKQVELKESLKETEEEFEGDTEKMVKGVLSTENKAERDSEEMKVAFSEDSSDKTEAAERIVIMDTLEKNLLGL